MKVLRMSGIEPSLKDGMITLQRSMEDLCADGLPGACRTGGTNY